MTSPPIPPNFSHRIWTIHRNDLIEQWGGQFPPSPPRGAATGRSSSHDSLDLRYFEVTNAPHKNSKDNNIEAVKLDHCDQELQYFHTAIASSSAFVICIASDVNNCELLRLRTNNY